MRINPNIINNSFSPKDDLILFFFFEHKKEKMDESYYRNYCHFSINDFMSKSELI